MDADQWLRLYDDFRAATDLDPTRLPRWEHFIDDEGGAACAGYIAEFLAGGHIATTDLDRVAAMTKAPSYRRHVGHSVHADGGDPAE